MKALVICNTYSGRKKHKKKINYIIDQLKTKYDEVQWYESTYPKNVTEYIEKKYDQYDLIVVAGGDGTVHEAFNGLRNVEVKCPIAVVPFGTCNDIARTLGLNKSLKSVMKIILQGQTADLDLFSINDESFVYGVACGYLSDVSYKAKFNLKRKTGKLAYYFKALDAVGYAKAIDATIKYDDKEISGKFAFVLALHSRYLASYSLHRKTPLDDGMIKVIAIRKKLVLFDILSFYKVLIFGGRNTKKIICADAKEVSIISNEPMDINTDGEYYNRCLSADLKKKKSISVIVNKNIKNKYFTKE